MITGRLLIPYKDSAIINIIFIIAVFLPVNTSSYILQGVIIFGLVFSSSIVNRDRIEGNFKYQKLMFYLWVSLSYFYNVVMGAQFETDSIIKIGYLTIILLSFPISRTYKIFESTIFVCIILIFITQISYPLNISFIIDMIDTYYARESFFNNSEAVMLNTYTGSLLDLRFGGVFRNPNQCARIVTLLYGVFLVNKINNGSSIFNVLSLLLFIPSILMTGSRTSLVIFIMLTGLYYYYKSKYVFKKSILILPVLMVVIVIFIGNINLDGRIFDFSELSGNENNASFTTKLNFLNNYISYASKSQPFDLFIGTFNVDSGDNFVFNSNYRIKNFDSEIGYVVYSLGFVGILLILWFYIIIYKNTGHNVKLLMIILLWSLTSTILTNMRFSFLFLFVLSIYYDKAKQKNMRCYEL